MGDSQVLGSEGKANNLSAYRDKEDGGVVYERGRKA